MNRSDRILLGVCFFVSGATALVYQVLWSRHLKLFFGSTTEAVSVVLAVFMAGLGIGARVLGRRIDRSTRPAAIYGALEFGIGVYALLTAPLLGLVRDVYAGLARSIGDPGLFSVFLKVPLATAALFLPAFAMGATLPALLRAISDTSERARTLVGVYYAINTLGAVAGVFSEAFILVERLGLETTMIAAAIVNLLLGSLVMVWGRKKNVEPASSGERPRLLEALRGVGSGREGRFVIWGLLVSGLVTMATEVVFFRVLGLIFGVFNHAFSLVLAVFLLGLAIGSMATAPLERRRVSRLRVFSAVYVVLAGLILLAQVGMPLLPRLVVYMRQIPGLTYGEVLLGKALLSAVFLLPFAVAAGMGVPILLAHLSDRVDRLAGNLGAAYLVNTVGTVSGSLLTGFVLLPLAGTEGTLLVMALLCAATGTLGLFLEPEARVRRLALGLTALVLVFVAVMPRWPAALFLSSDTKGRSPVLTSRLAVEEKLAASPQEPLFFKEGRNATVAVTRSADARILYIGGHPDASDLRDMPTQAFAGIVPFAVTPSARDVLVVGFGSGVTAGVLLKNPSVSRLDVVEMEKAVVETSPLFHHVNLVPEKDPRFRLFLDDARSYVAVTPRTYDLIVSEPSNPWRAGIANVFSLDFFLESKRVLKPRGVFAQWLQLYGLDFASVRLVLGTFGQAFKDVQVWWLDPYNLLLLGSDSGMHVEPKAFEELLARHYSEELRRYGEIRRPAEFYSRYLLGSESARKLSGALPSVHRDAFPVLEFEAPRGLFTADSQNHRRVLAAKIEYGEWLPVEVARTVPEGVAWLGFAGMLRHAGLWTEARDAYLRAVERGEAHRGFARAAGVALDAKDLEAAGLFLARASSIPSAPPPDALQELIIGQARLAAEEGKTEQALSILDSVPVRTAAVERNRLSLLVSLGRVEPALSLGRSLLASARLGSETGSQAVRDIYVQLERLATSRDRARELVPLIEKLPPPDAGFAQIPRLETLAVLYARAGRPAEAFQAAEEIAARGVLNVRTLLLKASLLEAAGDHLEAKATREEARILSPESLSEPVPVTLPALSDEKERGPR